MLIVIDAVLIAAALIWYGWGLWQGYLAGKASDDVLSELGETDSDWTDMYGNDGDLRVVWIDGYPYIGYLSVPELDLEMPVMDQWSMEGLEIAPGRYSGSIKTADMVIAGHNYRRHFAPLKFADPGTKVIFTDMDGNAYYYEISRTETVMPTDIEKMVSGDVDQWDMTLFTCTTGGRARCAIRCVRIENQ